VVLAYLKNETKKIHVFVANRVKTILDVSSKDQWHYVESKNNPADDASRGLSITKFPGSQQGTGFQATSVLTKGQRQRSRSKSEHNTRRQQFLVSSIGMNNTMVKVELEYCNSLEMELQRHHR